MIIGITGKKDTGKSLAARLIKEIMLQHNQQFWEVKAFGDKVKDVTAISWGLERSILDDRDFKDNYCINYLTGKVVINNNVPNGHFIVDSTDALSIFINYYNTGINFCFYEMWIPIRILIQYEGTEIGRNKRGKDCWINSLMKNYTFDWVISDIRYENEAKKIIDLEGTLIKTIRNTGNKDEHSSESELDSIEPHYIVDNNKFIGEVKKLLVSILKDRGYIND